MARILHIFILVLVLAWTTPGHAETIIIAADEWCPYNCAKADREGYVVDIMREIFQKQGITVEYRLMSWKRAVEEARAGRITAVICASKEEVDGFILPEEEVGIDFFSYYVRKDDEWQFMGNRSLLGKRLAVAEGYDLEDLDRFAREHKNGVQIYRSGKENPAQHNLKLLVNDRVDVVYDDDKVLRYQAHLLGLDQVVKNAGCSDLRDELYMAFSPADPLSRRYAHLFDTGIRALRQSGRLATLLNRYGLSDWQ